MFEGRSFSLLELKSTRVTFVKAIAKLDGKLVSWLFERSILVALGNAACWKNTQIKLFATILCLGYKNTHPYTMM